MGRRLSDLLYGHPKAQLSLLLSGPLGWLVVAYLGSLLVLFIAAFWQLDTFSGAIVKQPTTQNFETLVNSDVYRRIAFRTIGVAAAVTVTDALLAFPIAFFMAKVVTPRMRGLLVVAGSIFTFALTLGDYITPSLVSSTQFIGNVVFANVGVANNLPLAAAFATVPVVVMIVYLLIARRLGAFESL